MKDDVAPENEFERPIPVEPFQALGQPRRDAAFPVDRHERVAVEERCEVAEGIPADSLSDADAHVENDVRSRGRGSAPAGAHPGKNQQ